MKRTKYISFTEDQKALRELLHEVADNAAALLDKIEECDPDLDMIYVRTMTQMYLEAMERFIKIRELHDGITH